MQPALDETEFFSAPHGRYLLAPGLVYWCAGPTLWGVTFAGSMDLSRADRLIGWIEAEFRHPYPAYDTILDFTALSALEEAAFARWSAWYRSSRERQPTRVLRAALVRPAGGLVGSLVAGFTHVLGPLIPSRVCADLDEALRWLELPEPARLAAELAALQRVAAAPASPLEAIRQMLERSPRDATAEGVAARLGLSVRTLQRHLRAAGTRFEHELQSARVRHAQRLLAASDEKLGAVAHAAGFATQAHFNAVFRRVIGESPGQWRARARAGR